MNKNKSIRIIFFTLTAVIICFTFKCLIAYEMDTRSLPETKGEIIKEIIVGVRYGR